VKGGAVLALGDDRLALDTLFLDGGGVLVNPNWDRVSAALADHGVPASAAALRAAEPLHDYHSRSNLWESVPADVPGALRRFKAAGLRLVVVSNANGTVQALFDRLGLAAWFDYLFDSHVERVEKPDPRFFARALERSGSRADRTVHVGDLYHVDVVGARSAGLGAVLLDSAGLYPGADCPRVGALGELADALRASPPD
jgi:HAD superfamily hydrolase (TIGR01509 family)